MNAAILKSLEDQLDLVSAVVKTVLAPALGFTSWWSRMGMPTAGSLEI